MKKYLTLAASALLLAACSEKPGYEINGTVANTDLNGKYVYLYEYGVQDAAPMDSALVQNGTFTFKGTQNAPALRKLAFAEDVVEPKRAASGENAPFTSVFVLENGKLQAVLDEAASAVSGTPENDGLKALQAQMKTLRADLEKLSADMKSEDKEVVSAAEKKYDEIDQKVTDAVKTYILNNTTKQSAAKLLYDFRYSLDEAAQNEIIAKADSAFKAVPNIDKLMAHLDVLKTVAVGKKFVDFEMADPNGKTHKLSEFVGNGKNIVLIDFWASWCPPCRRDMPNLVAAYKKYKNKGFDLTLEALARLNYKLKMIGSDITVVMSFITNRPVYSINPDVLNARGVMEELRKTTQGLGAQMGEDLFNYLASHARGTDLPDMNDFVNETIRFRIKRTLQSWKTNTLPPVVTHNIVDDYKDDILNFLRSSGLVNKKEDRVKVVYHPAFISPDNPLFGMEYSEFVRGCHLGIFPSYYEPWGYTPCESIASGVPAVTSDLAGFGDYVENFTSGDESRGIKVLHRKNHSFGQAAEDLANYLLRFATSIPRERLLLRSGAEDFSVEFDWKNLIRYYFDIYDHICGVEKGKIK